MAYRFLFNRSVRRARAVIAVSNATQKDLLSYYAQSSAQKTHVIYPGLDFQHITAVSQSSRRIQRPYILYVGNCKEHKNVPLLLEAYHASGISTSHDLLLVTSGREAKSLTLPHGAQVLSNVPHEDLPVLYGGAAGFATATLMEGFGFPILEAMAQRCPVLATTCGSLPEISAGHALLVQPTLADLSKGLQRLVSDPSFHSDSWLNAAAEHARTFTWERTAEGVVRVLLHAFRSDENCMSY
jgi:glycosyltransferase involved in cell wall biosynthesis